MSGRLDDWSFRPEFQAVPVGSRWRNRRTQNESVVLRHRWTRDGKPMVVYRAGNSASSAHPGYFLDHHDPLSPPSSDLRRTE